MHTEMIRDSFNAGKLDGVMKIGNAYFFCCTYTQQEIEKDVKAIASIFDWADGRKPATQKRLRDIFAARGLTAEARYDAAHGRRYKLCVYPRGDADARRVTLAASDGMGDTNPEIARPIF